MSMNDPLGDMLDPHPQRADAQASPRSRRPASQAARARARRAARPKATSAATAEVEQSTARSEIEIELKYFDGAPVIREIARVSKPGRRVYASVKALPPVNNGLGISILSTPKGVMSDHDARDAQCRRRN